VEFRNPKPTVDVILRVSGGIVLIRRRNPPHGWALPGGFVDEGEPVEAAARREAMEEIGLEAQLDELLYVYSDPARDPRQHTLSVVFTGRAAGQPVAADDAAAALVLPLSELRRVLDDRPARIDGLPIVFDHAQILRDYVVFIETGRRPRPV
jgi:8-oxo-dGTP diphosphatase